jgi:nucleotide-binding universal stress UspA family protein
MTPKISDATMGNPMSIKTILALADGGDSGAAVLASAVGVARRFSAHLDVLHVKADPIDLIPVVSEGMSGAVVATLIETMTDLVAKREVAARSAYDRACRGADLSTAWHVRVGREPAILPIAGRFADLLAIGRPDKAANSLPETFDAALFESGRPVLILPAKEVKAVGERVVIAWNGSAESARAVTAAIPFLRLASQVDVVTIGDVGKQAPADALVPYLARHDVKITIHALNLKRTIGIALLEAALRLEAGLLVMGAYGHTRLREWILGGATRELLDDGDLPILMMH